MMQILLEDQVIIISCFVSQQLLDRTSVLGIQDRIHCRIYANAAISRQNRFLLNYV